MVHWVTVYTAHAIHGIVTGHSSVHPGRRPSSDRVSCLQGTDSTIGKNIVWYHRVRVPFPRARNRITDGDFSSQTTRFETKISWSCLKVQSCGKEILPLKSCSLPQFLITHAVKSQTMLTFRNEAERLRLTLQSAPRINSSFFQSPW